MDTKFQNLSASYPESKIQKEMELTDSFFLVDNRVVPHFDFRTEAVSAAFQCFLCDLISKLIYLSQSYSWLRDPLGFGIAASPTTVKVLQLNISHLGQLKTHILEQRFSALGGIEAANSTWGEFVSDGLSKILNNIPQQTFVAQRDIRVVITIYSTDLHLFGGLHCGSIKSGLTTFKRLLEHINQNFPANSVEVRIVSVLIQNTDTSIAPNENHALFFSEIIEYFGSFVKFQTLQVTAFDFEEELKLLLGEFAPKRLISFDLPPFMGQKFSLSLQLIPQSMNSVSCIPFLNHIEICGVTDRMGINPLLLQGTPLSVVAPMDQLATKQLGSSLRVFQNKIMLETFISWASKNNYIFIVRAPFIESSSSPGLPVNSPYCHYWALIPPIMSMEHRDSGASSILSAKYFPTTFDDISIYNKNKSIASSSMTLILLYDREQLLLPRIERQSKYFAENIQKFADDVDLFEKNAMMIAEMTKFLDATMIPCFGKPSPYEPMNFASGHLDSKLSKFRPVSVLQEVQSVPSNAVAAIPTVTEASKISNRQIIQPVEHRQQQTMIGGERGGRGGGRGRGNSGRGKKVTEESKENHLELVEMPQTRSSSLYQRVDTSTTVRRSIVDDEEAEFEINEADIFKTKSASKKKNPKRKLHSVFLEEGDL